MATTLVGEASIPSPEPGGFQGTFADAKAAFIEVVRSAPSTRGYPASVGVFLDATRNFVRSTTGADRLGCDC